MIHKTTRSILSVLLAALLLVTSTPLTPAFAGEGAVSLQSESGESEGLTGDGTREDPYQIGSAEQLAKFRDKVNKGETDADAVLTADINLNPDMKIDEDGTVANGDDLDPWIPIGNSSQQYRGTFNGDGHTISGLYINSSSANNQGLFGYVYGGTVKNLSVSGSVSGNNYVGGVVGYNNEGRVENCHNIGEVSGTSNYVGGVVGSNSFSAATVTNCYNTGKVSGSEYVGGVVGSNSFSAATVTNCYNTGEVSGYSHVGGVVGGNSDSTVENCYNTGSVNGSGNLYVGGVVGYNSDSGSVTNCYFLQQDPAIYGIGNDNMHTGATDVSDLTDQDQFKGWDFTDIWRISQSLGFPVLQDNAQDGLPPGLGTEASPYEISTADQLKNFATAVNGKDDQTADPDAHAKLMNDIDLNPNMKIDEDGKVTNGSELDQWTPIGNSESTAYTGTFNGQNFKISGLYIKNTSSVANYQGLFGYLGTGGTVKDLSVSGTVSGNNFVGGVVGDNRSGSVENCCNIGEVSGNNFVGGVVGYSSGGISASASVTNCYNIGEVSGNSYVGGVVGHSSGGISASASVTNCYNTGTVTGTDDYVGGVVGSNDSGISASASVTNCYYQTGKGATVGIGGTIKDDISQTAAKSLEDFHSGEVAYLLQNGQKAAGAGEPIPLVWGQSKLGETTSLPTLNPTDEQRVYQVTFDYGDSFAEADDRYDYHYANANDNVTLPTSTDPIPEYEGHTLTGWQNEDGQAVTEPITVTADTTFTAQWTKDTVNYTVTVSADPEAGGTVSGSGEYSEGTQVTVTATPATGYHFVNWTENGTEVSTEATFTFNATVDRNLIAIFAKNEDPEPTPTPDPEPSGPSTGDSSGWDDIRDELENAENGDQITIDMGDETKVPAEIFESLAGKDVEISFDLGDIQWSVNGADIPTDTDFTDLDLGVNLDTSGIPVNVINTITGEVGTVQITLAHDGEFGFTMTLTAPLGKENAGYWANLYHYDEDAEALNFEAAAKIDEDGSVTIPFSHASQYAIVIDTHSHATVDVSDLFIDVAPNAWYKDAVQYAYDNGLMTGVSDTEFAPEQTTTRAMIVSILARLEGVTTAQAAGFADVNDDWYATAVNWAANVGVVNGYEDNTFRPNQPITREQLAAILMNYAAYKGYDVSVRADLSHYSDADSISSWANDVLLWAVAEGLLTGVTDDTIAPQAHATRAQVAAILQRFLSE